MRQVNAAGEKLIKDFESLRLSVYQDQRGKWTIGYGHTKGVTADTAPINLWQAEQFFLEDLKDAISDVIAFISIDLTDNEFAALVSLVYNAGAAPLKGTLGMLLNHGNLTAAANQFDRWNHCAGVVDAGLSRRRSAEKALFLSAA